VPRGGAPGEPTRLRCRVIDSDMPPYRESPKVAGLRAATVGGTARAVHGEATDDEPLGTSTGQPRQRFQVQQPPIVGPESIVVECRHGRETDDYVEVESFAESKPDSLHVTVERASGEIVFGPAIRDRSGPADTPGERPRQLGAIPPAGSRLVVRRYLTGGGEEGNVARGELQVLKTTIPFVARVENRLAATGGRAAETVEEACVRGPIELRTRERAVTAEDYEYFARRASGAVANARCVPPAEPGGPALLAVVPRLPRVAEAVIDPARLVTPASVKRAVRDELDRRRVLGARVEVRDAAYQGVRVDALVRVLPGSDAGTVAERATAALHRYFHPTRGGPDGDGWEFGRAAYSGMAYLVLQRVDGVEIVQELRLYPVDLATGAAGEATQRVELAPDAVVVSRDHRVAVVAEGTDE
jgi:predicted phage baseplate assembly protein